MIYAATSELGQHDVGPSGSCNWNAFKPSLLHPFAISVFGSRAM